MILFLLLGTGFCLYGHAQGDYTRYEYEDVSRFRHQVEFQLPPTPTITKPVPTPPKQSVDPVKFPAGSKLYLEVDPGLDALVERHKEIGQQTGSQPVSGYRIQIFSGSREGAQRAYANFQTQYSYITAYLRHDPPSYRVRAGNFIDRNEAQSVCNRVRAHFPNAWVVKDKVPGNTRGGY